MWVRPPGGRRWALVAGGSTVVLLLLGIGLRLDGFTGVATAAQILSLAPWIPQLATWARGEQGSPKSRGVTRPYGKPTEIPGPEIRRAVRDLRDRVTSDLLGDEDTRHARFGLPLRWQPAPPGLAGEWTTQIQPGQLEPESWKSAGRSTLIDGYLQIPAKRLVILGRPGSGKTTMAKLLAFEWLRGTPASSGHTIMRFRIDSWNPKATLLDELMRDQMAVNYDQDASLIEALLSARQVIPVLDGFDEMAPALRLAALRELNESDRPLILLSRTEEYQAAIEEYGKTEDTYGQLHEAAGIILDDLLLTDPAVGGYLRDNSSTWGEVLGYAGNSPDGAAAAHLISAVSTPLMIYLAHEKFKYTDRNPALLLDHDRFSTACDVEVHLSQQLIASASNSPAATPGHPWRTGKAERWLGFLASAARGSPPRVCWWRLEVASFIPFWVPMTCSVAAFGVTCGLAPVLLFGPWLSSGTATAVGVLGGLFGVMTGLFGCQSLPSSGVSWFSQILRGWLIGGVAGYLVGILIATIILSVYSNQQTTAREAVLAHITFFFWLLGGWFWAGKGFYDRMRGDIEMPVDSNPAGLLWADLRALALEFVLLATLFGGITGGLAAFSTEGIPGALTITEVFWRGLMLGLFYALAFALTAKAWTRCMFFGRIPLTLAGLLPWRVTSFFEDAHRREILRHVGAEYEFKVEAVQRYLVNSHQTRSRQRWESIKNRALDEFFGKSSGRVRR